MPTTLSDDDLLFRLLRQLDIDPEAAQRALASALGVSLGRLNAVLRAATEAGLVAQTERAGSDKRRRIAYGLTAKGAAAKARLVDQFLARKLDEYNALHAELTGTNANLSPPEKQEFRNAKPPVPDPGTLCVLRQRPKAQDGSR